MVLFSFWLSKNHVVSTESPQLVELSPVINVSSRCTKYQDFLLDKSCRKGYDLQIFHLKITRIGTILRENIQSFIKLLLCNFYWPIKVIVQNVHKFLFKVAVLNKYFIVSSKQAFKTFTNILFLYLIIMFLCSYIIVFTPSVREMREIRL